MESLRQDFIYALRFMRKHRGFAILIVLCLALGIGANSAIFSVVDAVLLRPLPYPDSDRLMVLLDIHQGAGSEAEEFNVSGANFLAWRDQSRSFEALEAMLAKPFNLVSGGEPERIEGAAVTAGFFDLLGTTMKTGRDFTADEDRPGGNRTVVLSDGLWQRRFGGDPGILGKPLTIDGQSYTVVGITKPGFRFVQDADLWVPLALDPSDPPPQHQLIVAGRLKPSQTLEEVRSEMGTIAARLERDSPDTNAGYTVAVQPLRDSLVRERRRGLLLLLAAVGLLLLIACANVGNLLLVRASEQRNEIAIRAAFGASRGRLVRQTLTESVVLALAGGLAGVPVAEAALWALPRLATEYASLLQDVRLDLRVLVFTFILSLATGLLPGLLPALKTSTPNLYRRLTAGGGRRSTEGVRGRRIQSSLVVFEVAVALFLLVCAGLMVKSFALINRVALGFDRENVLTAQVSLPESGYDNEQSALFWRDLIARVSALPGVAAAGATTVLPVAVEPVTTTFTLEGQANDKPEETQMANFRRVSPDFFKVLDIPLKTGRLFTAGDDATATPVAVVSEEMARRYWPGQSPIGKRLLRTSEAAKQRWLTVVGKVGDIQDSALGAENGATFYVPIAQGARPTMVLVAKTKPSVEPMSLVPALRHTVLELDRNQPIDEIVTLEEHISGSLASRRFNTFMWTLFAALGMALAVLGIYSVLSYSVSQRSHEIGVRMALGAQAGDVVRLILRRGMGLALSGLVIGLAAAVLFTRVLENLLYSVRPTDPIVFAGIAVGLILVALLASWLPARRAARLDPIVTLRAD
ncbi:MAG TPA: ABC transporter permease [Thermoanaerobaculia bacterium]|jgi:putative ABC transport system permease protein|nr:ABC transporter permease [Thermoanaerobaculia bacterium]